MLRLTYDETKIWSNIKKSQNIIAMIDSKLFFLLFMPLLTVSIAKTSILLTGISFISLKTTLDQTWKAYSTKFVYQWNNRKSRYQVRQILTLFCILILGSNCDL